jgi:hypothetical protein
MKKINEIESKRDDPDDAYLSDLVGATTDNIQSTARVRKVR